MKKIDLFEKWFYRVVDHQLLVSLRPWQVERVKLLAYKAFIKKI